MRVEIKIVILTMITVVTLGLVASFLLSPPRSWNDAEPPGWPNKYPEKTLSGMIAASNRLAYEIWVTPPMYSRAVAYASAAYWDAYRADSVESSIFNYPTIGEPSPNAGVTAYSKVFNELIPTPATLEFRDYYDNGDVRGIASADYALKAASLDGFSNDTVGYREILERDGVTEFDKYEVWLPVYNSGVISEPGWGELRPIFPEVLSCKVPPPSYSREVLEKEGELFEKFYRESGNLSGLYSSLYGAWNPDPSFHTPSLILALDSIALTSADAGTLSTKNSDSFFLQYAVMLHDLNVVTYREKYKYKLPAIQNFHNIMTITTPYYPSYPSLPAASSNAVVKLIGSFYPGTKPRLEVPGTLLNQPWNRVLGSVSDIKSEVETLSYVSGYGYTFDYPAGAELGSCVYDTLSGKFKDKGLV